MAKRRLKKDNKVAGRFAGEKKKTAMAACLVALMLMMWVRVLLRQGPDQAAAGQAQGSATEQPSIVEISYVELPVVPGRNDSITTDFFTVKNWNDFAGSMLIDPARPEIQADDKHDDRAAIERITNKLELDAVVMGQKPQAFINGELYSVGQAVTITDDAGTMQLQVTMITSQKVHIGNDDVEIKLQVEEIVER